MKNGFYAKESVMTGEKEYWDRALRSSPFPSLESARRYAENHKKPDNQPYVIDGDGGIVYVCPKGRDYK